MQKKWMLVAMLNLLIAMSIGALLRFAFIEEISWLKFKNFMHAHSHVAMLGWVYLTLYTYLVSSFLPKTLPLKKYHILFWLTQGSVIGMLITFPIMGYASWSIGFSILNTFLIYTFVFIFFRDLKKLKQSAKQLGQSNIFSIKFIKFGLFFLTSSTIGLWAIGPIIAMEIRGGALFYSSVQFYLHFQFNGWFIFTILGLFFKILENNNIIISILLGKRFFYLLLISCFLTFALAITWSKPLPVLFLINSLGVILQLIALFYFLKIIKIVWKKILPQLNTSSILLFKMSFTSFVLKILVQSAVVVPAIGIIGYTIRNYVMGFLHLMLIGMVSLFLFGYGQQIKLLHLNSLLTKTGKHIFIVGFILSETVLIFQGTMFWGAMGFMPYYYELLFGASALIPLGLLLMLVGQYKVK